VIKLFFCKSNAFYLNRHNFCAKKTHLAEKPHAHGAEHICGAGVGRAFGKLIIKGGAMDVC